MTELERLWDDLPTSAAPVDDVLRAARRAEAVRRRRLVLRPLLSAGVLLALVAAFVTGTHLGSAERDPDTAGPALPGTADASPVAFRADLPPAESCEQLRRTYVDRALGLVTAWGWDFGWVVDASGAFMDAGPTPLRGAASSATVRQTASETGTNVQESGVDEPDSVKTDGRLLVRVRHGDLVVEDITGAAVRELAVLDLPRLAGAELLLAGDTVVAVGADATAPNDGRGLRGSRVVTVSLADPSAPTVTHEVAHSSSVVTARQHDHVVRLVLSAGLPALDFLTPRQAGGQAAALAHNRAAVESSRIEDWLPTYDAGQGAVPLLDCTDVAIPPERLSLDTVSIVGFPATDPTEPVAIGLAGAATTAYASADDLYLAAAPVGWWGGGCRACLPTLRSPGTDDGSTQVFDFVLDGDRATHVASGRVAGLVSSRWSMDSADNTLRLAVGPSSETGNANAIVTLRRDGERLVEVGRLDGLGRREDIKAVRWFDDLAIVVTYRQVDPLYTVDLTDPARPRLLGKLKIPGFSSYLHPLGERRLVGVGSDDRGDAQAGLFDVDDLSDVRRLDIAGFGRDAWALAGEDPRLFTWLPEHRTVLTVIQRGRTAWLAVLGLADGRFRQRLVHAGHRADLVRTVGLADGRVVLVTGSGTRLLRL